MVDPSPFLFFDAKKLTSLFPFHLLIDRNLNIETCGNSMKKLNGDCVNRRFTECFQLIRPVEADLNFNVLSGLENKLLILKTCNIPASDILIKGQFTYFEEEEKLFFSGTPWFNSLEELQTNKLLISDFPHHNLNVDLLHLLKAKEIVNEDLRRLVTTTNDQRDKLKAGEEQISIALQKERELNQLKSNFVTFASHEFRTPIACIRSSMEVLEVNLTRPITSLKSTLKQYKNILTEVDHLNELIDKFLIVGKIESTAFTCTKEKVDLSLLLETSITNLSQFQDDARSVTLLNEAEQRPVMADPLLLKHIFNNLLLNALKYSKGKEQPVVTIRYSVTETVIEIRDFGIGIPTDHREKIFDAFFRADTVQNIPGTGLGLFITKSFVELHGGTISVKSNAETGTQFSVSLPLN